MFYSFERPGKFLVGLLVSALAIMILNFIPGCNALENRAGEAAPVEKLDERIVNANNALGFDIFHELNPPGEELKNTFISPSSILTALAMTLNGAEGDTRMAMKETLRLKDMSREEVNNAFADLLTILGNPDPEVELLTANSMWVREGVDFKTDFLDQNTNYFGAELAVLDFDNPESANTINQWVREQTAEAIEKIVEPPIDPNTILFLINAIYFKGEWSAQFDPDLTRDISFSLPDNTLVDVPVMFQNDNFSYFENDLFQAVSLPYGKNERISMYVFLPSEDKGLEGLFEEMNADKWAEWMKAFIKTEGEIGLPRFEFEYETSLNNVLTNLGMGIAFDYNTADFSGMHPIPPRLVISDVKHKSFVEVNEEGTEAAAVTSVEIEVTSMPEENRFSMIVDRPFFFAIADNTTGTILFMGSVADPA